ncbi:hypothetical protein GOP47_0003787 [Adiantum capillus-veneris]|uniref:Uncharacterized protein n=1 Tax=Adiantum capillus-veneris TaxID=13818 RepID=A0A9D4ZM79_ADICA|nr:hypothetical protein GOP47_0003787 [Adiantum capillus-veneris]
MTGRHAAVRERRATSPAILTDKAPEDTDNPFQVWYKDDWWRFTEDKAGNPAFALINNGSKAALKADADATPSHVSLFTEYDRSKDTTLTTAWTLRAVSSSSEYVTIFSVALQMPLRLGIGASAPKPGEGVAAILNASSSSATGTWTLEAFVPKAYILQSQWVSQILVAKPPHTDVTFTSGAGSFNNELGVVGVNQANTNGVQEVWYKVPAASPLEDSNSSFFIISKMNGKALKGSTKPGDKVILTEFDPLDYNFVWSEDRSLKANGVLFPLPLDAIHVNFMLDGKK